MKKLNKENLYLTYFLSRPFTLGITYSLMFSYAQNDAIIGAFIGVLIGLLLIYIFHKFKLNKTHKILLLTLYIIFLITVLVVLEVFVHSFLLTRTPKLFIALPSILLAFFIASKKKNVLKKSLIFFLAISFAIYFLIILSLLTYVKIDNMFPLFTHSSLNIFLSGFVFGFLTASPNILLLNEGITSKDHMKNYTIMSVFNVIVPFMIIVCLTKGIASIYSFPEYMILKRIKIFEFIENVENLSSSLWYFDIIVFMSLLFKNIKKTVKKNISYISIIIITTLFTTFYLLGNYYRTLWYYHNLSYIFLALFIIMLFYNLLKKKYK